MQQVSGASSSNGYILKSCHLRWRTPLWILCNDACHYNILCKHCSGSAAQFYPTGTAWLTAALFSPVLKRVMGSVVCQALELLF